MMGEDIRYHSDLEPQRRFVFLGKAAIYSAGTTFMSFFARDNRYLTRGTRLMIHERKLDKQLHVSGPLTTCIAAVTATLHEIEASIVIQNEGFASLIQGSSVSMQQVLERAPGNWYIEAQEAVTLGWSPPCSEPRRDSRHDRDAHRDRQPGADRGPCRQAVGCADPALDRLFQHRARPDAARDDRGVCDPQARGGPRQPRQRTAGRGGQPPDRDGLRRTARRPALGHVPAACLDDRQRHAVQHEPQRGDLEPLLPACRHAARRQAAGASERPCQHVAIIERQLSVGDVHGRRPRRDPAADPVGCRPARRHRRQGTRLVRHRQDRPHPHAGRNPDHAGSGVVRVCRPARGWARAAARCATARLPTCPGRHRGRHRHQRGSRLCRGGDRGDRARHRPALRQCRQQVRCPGLARCAGAALRHAAHAGGHRCSRSPTTSA